MTLGAVHCVQEEEGVVVAAVTEPDPGRRAFVTAEGRSAAAEVAVSRSHRHPAMILASPETRRERPATQRQSSYSSLHCTIQR